MPRSSERGHQRIRDPVERFADPLGVDRAHLLGPTLTLTFIPLILPRLRPCGASDAAPSHRDIDERRGLAVFGRRSDKVTDVQRAQVNRNGFNTCLELPYALRLDVFAIAMDDIYDMLHNLNTGLAERGLLPFENSVRGAIYTGVLSDLMTEALANHSAGLVKNTRGNGHPDLLPAGRYSNDAALSAEEGVEVKVTKKAGGAVDMHSDRPAWYCVFRYIADYTTQPVIDRAPTRFTDVWLARLDAEHFRKNPRGERGTRTATPHREGVRVLRSGWLYRDP